MGRTLILVLFLLILEAVLSGLRPLLGIAFMPHISLLGMIAVTLRRPLTAGYGAALLLGIAADINQVLPLGTLTLGYVLTMVWTLKQRTLLLILPLGGRWLRVMGLLLCLQLGIYLWIGLLTDNWLSPRLLGYQALGSCLLALPVLALVKSRFV